MAAACSMATCLAAVLLLTGAASADEVTSRGLQRTRRDAALVEKSVERTNAILAGTGLRLAPAWKSVPAADEVPVYLVKVQADTATTPASVPQDCRCIFVDPAFLGAWTSFNSQGKGRLGIDRGYFLTFVLLHEAGHLKDGTPSGAFKGGEAIQLNIDPSQEKAAERRADEFAATLLRKASSAKAATSGSIDANFVVNELVKLSWNMQAFRTLDEFGSFITGKPGVYFDSGYTHPNMALRVLRVNDLIHSSETTRQLLQAFEEARSRGASPRPLYQAKP